MNRILENKFPSSLDVVVPLIPVNLRSHLFNFGLVGDRELIHYGYLFIGDAQSRHIRALGSVFMSGTTIDIGQHLHQLLVANFMGQVAYGVEDDFIDGAQRDLGSFFVGIGPVFVVHAHVLVARRGGVGAGVGAVATVVFVVAAAYIFHGFVVSADNDVVVDVPR
jgi:hypothetical protein